jgi:hypothetical protein
VIVRVVVTVLPGLTMQEACSTRGTRLTRFTETRLLSMVRALAILTMAGRDGGFSAMWIAPPPMIAPPAVQAHNFANAILTDISSTLFCRGPGEEMCSPPGLLCPRSKSSRRRRVQAR